MKGYDSKILLLTCFEFVSTYPLTSPPKTTKNKQTNPKSTRISQTSQPTPPTSSSGPTDGLCSLPLLPETEKLGNDALQPGNRHGFGNKNLYKSILFIKNKQTKYFGGSGTCLFPQKQGPRVSWEGVVGCPWSLASHLSLTPSFLLETKKRPERTRVNGLSGTTWGKLVSSAHPPECSALTGVP